MTKPEIIQSIIHNLRQDLSQAMFAAEEALKGATHEQSKAETQYDTLGLEHAYLAEGQSRRIDTLGAEITRLDNWQAPDFSIDDEVYLGALIELTHTITADVLSVFLAPAGGGQKIEGLTLHVITPDTPLAASILGRCIGDIAKLPNGQVYEITNLN
jgi:hypothetical protein